MADRPVGEHETPRERAAPDPLPTDAAHVRTEMRTGLADVRTEIAGVQTAIARLGEQHAKTEASRLRWTLGAIIAGSSLGVAVLRLLGD